MSLCSGFGTQPTLKLSRARAIVSQSSHTPPPVSLRIRSWSVKRFCRKIKLTQCPTDLGSCKWTSASKMGCRPRARVSGLSVNDPSHFVMDCSSERRVSFGSQLRCSESTFYLQTFGQLKLAIAFRNGVLVVDIIEAKSLAGSDQGICSCYVKVGMAPDSGGATRQKTEMVPDSRSPVFHETFLFVVGHEEKKKRLLFTAWNSAGSTRRCCRWGS
ncbi:hypothetical protein MHYP_G00283650 [Metynnis hypsauchen]